MHSDETQNAFHDLTQFFSCLSKLLVLQTKKPEDTILGFGGIAKCLINTAFVKETSYV